MKYDVAIFDIDGTLVPFGENAPSEKTLNYLRKLQKNNVIVIIATGRCLQATKAILGGFVPNYYVCSNGAHILDKKDKTLSRKTFTEQEMYALVDFCEDYDYPLAFTFEDGYYVYVNHQDYIGDYVPNGSGDYIFNHEDQNRHLQSMPHAGCAHVTQEQSEEFNLRYSHLGLRIVNFCDTQADVYQGNLNKAVAIDELIKQIGKQNALTVAFGDGLNDVEMLQHANYGVCLKRQNAQLCAVAQSVQDNIEQAIESVFEFNV